MTAPSRPEPSPLQPASDPDPDPDRARILAAARAHFFAEGFHTFTMDDLARELGMSKKTLYRHYPAKEALLDAIIDDLAGEVGSFLAGVKSAGHLPVARQLQQVIDGIAGRLAPIQPVFLQSLKRHAPRQFDRIEHLRRRNLENHLVPILESGRQRGEVRLEVEPRFVVDILLYVLDGLFATSLLQRLGRPPAAAVAGVLDLFFRGILNPQPLRPR